MAKRCEHNVCFSSKVLEFEADILTESELYDTLKDEIDKDHNSYVNNESDFNFNRKNFFSYYADGDGYYDLDIYIFDHCPDCGDRIYVKELKNKINNKLMSYVKTLSRERKPVELKQSTLVNIPVFVGYVYLIKMGEYYKIGISQNPKKRIKEFTLLPQKLEIILTAKVNDYARIEEELHEKYKAKRVRGEWFGLDDLEVKEITDYLTSIQVDI
jgi:hypothetical protein